MAGDPVYPYFFAGGFRGLFYVMGYRRILKSPLLWISVFASCLITALCVFLDLETYEVLLEVIENVMSIFPNFIGFALAAYTIVVGSGSQALVDNTMQKRPDMKFSLYQTTNSVWGYILLVNVVALVIAFCFSLINTVSTKGGFIVDERLSSLANLAGLFSIVFVTIYAFLLQIRMVRLIFELGQKTFFFFSKTKMNGEEKDSAIIKFK